MSIEQLRATPLFAELEEVDLERLAALSEPMQLAPGEVLLEEGTPGDAMFVVLSGELEVTKRSGGSELPIARVGPGALQGEMAALEGRERSATVRALSDVEVLRIPREALRELLATGPDVALGILRTVAGRLRSTEATLRQREKLAALGTLAAGLAHELNNPAAAISRSVASLDDAIREHEALATPPGAVRGLEPPAAVELDPLERGDRTDALLELIDDVEAAAALVDAGWTVEALRSALGELAVAERTEAAAWLAGRASVQALLGEVGMAAERISEIVGAVKSYAYLDQAPVQRVDVRIGLENTLVILRHKLKGGVSVQREYADGLPEIEAYGSELNQVWTNIIDNAVDAMNGRGELLVRAEPSDGGVRVTICDSGPGIPAEVLPRLFEPFFTTKPPGVGSGLGLHISHNVIVRHGGRVDVTSDRGRTCFVVTLPPTLPH